jgi:Na+/proline symporter
MKQKKDFANTELSFMIAIVLGLVLGIMIKKIKFGLLVGVVMGVLFVLGTWLRLFRKNKHDDK